MENSWQTDRPKFEKLGRYYLIALGSIAIIILFSQVLVQKFISDQENDSRLINISGRQRMLSQQISKCALLLGTATPPEQRQQRITELKTALQEWTEAHEGLQQGRKTRLTKGGNSNKIQELLVPVNLHYLKILEAAEGIIQKLTNDIDLPPENLEGEIHTIITHERNFLRDMDHLVFQYDDEAETRVMNLKSIVLFLMIISLGVILFEIFFIFFPSARSIRAYIQKLSASQEKSKSMIRELSVLYSSLEQAYQDLLEVDVVVEDFTVYAKCGKNG